MINALWHPCHQGPRICPLIYSPDTVVLNDPVFSVCLTGAKHFYLSYKLT